MKKLSASGIKSADFRIQIAEKTHDPPYRLSEKWMTPPYMHSLNTGDPPPIFCHPPPPLKFMNSPLCVGHKLQMICEDRTVKVKEIFTCNFDTGGGGTLICRHQGLSVPQHGQMVSICGRLTLGGGCMLPTEPRWKVTDLCYRICVEPWTLPFSPCFWQFSDVHYRKLFCPRTLNQCVYDQIKGLNTGLRIWSLSWLYLLS